MLFQRKLLLLIFHAVIVDKPITTSYADAVELSKLAKSRNLILTAYQNRR